MNKNHVLSMHTQKFGISSKLQGVISLLAQTYVFEEAENVLEELLGIEICAKQIQRLSEHYGQSLEESEKDYQDFNRKPPLVVSQMSDTPVYVTIDGSMVYTREEDWKEMKLGRIYSENARADIQENRTEIIESVYVSSFGNNKEFFKKLEPYVEPYRHKVFIADGAKWIWNWVEDFYDDSVQILDFYHAVEKLSAYALLTYKDTEQRQQWLDRYKQYLKDDKVEEVINELNNLTGETPEANKALKDVIRYYQSNMERMKYGTFIKKGYLIGSGSIESAHRNVIQQRLKLSGQRWSVDGAQRIANLRVYRKSNRWKDVVALIKMAA